MSDTLADLVRAATQALTEAGIENAAREARILAAHAAGVTLTRLPLILDRPITPQVADMLDRKVAQRAARIPLAHITGMALFYKHSFRVTPDVLVPRSDTETLVIEALSQRFTSVLDLGTGTGCILLSLLDEVPGASGVGTDLSPDALRVADENCKDLHLEDRCLFVQSNWFENVEGQFDLIVSNPPYIAADEMAGLSPEVKNEPSLALTDNGDGLTAYRVIVPGAVRHLAPHGRLLVEIGWQQARAVSDLFHKAGYTDLSVIKDIEGRDRVISGIRPENL